MICSVFVNFVFLSFPILCYFLYLIYSKTKIISENNIFFDLALFMSFYLFEKFGKVDNINFFLIYVPFMLALYKKRSVIAFVLSVLIAYKLSMLFSINIFLILFINILIFIISILTNIKKNKIYIICMMIFIIITLRSINLYIVLSFILSCLLITLVFYLYDKFEDMLNVYYSLKEVKKEKKLYESLFKITHEIKNPLAVCKGYLDMFDINNKNKANKYIGIINQEINRTLELLKDFSDVSKSININKNTMDITLLIDDVCDEAKFIFQKNINFSYNYEKEEVYIKGDYTRLKQVLINVIKNAKEAIEKEGNVSLKAKIKDNSYIIDIKDDGCGMEKVIKDKIGTPFFTTKKNGTGLGVCFSKEIIEKHNGQLKYYSNQKKGTLVKIILPLNKA